MSDPTRTQGALVVAIGQAITEAGGSPLTIGALAESIQRQARLPGLRSDLSSEIHDLVLFESPARRGVEAAQHRRPMPERRRAFPSQPGTIQIFSADSE
jgi:hypothetical protein